MKKRLLAVAVASVFSVPAVYAQQSTVQIFGRLNAEYALHVNQGLGPKGDRVDVDILQTPSSEIGLRGEEKLGGSLSAWFQCATTADVRGQTQAGFCSRNSGVGLKGAYGNVWAGNWDTPFKRAARTNLVMPTTGIGGVSFLLFGGSTTLNGRDSAGVFSRRQNNSINYDSPNLGGVQLMLSSSTTNQATNVVSSVQGAKPRLFSVGAQYNNGPFNIGGAWEEHKNFQPVIANAGNDTGFLITAGYLFNSVKIGALYTQQKFETGPGAELKVNAWHLATDWKIAGPHGLRASYTRAGNTSGGGAAVVGSNSTRPASGSNTGADLWQIRYYHTLSKRTEVDAGYVKLNNQAGALYSLGGLSAPAAGTNQDAWLISMRHQF